MFFLILFGIATTLNIPLEAFSKSHISSGGIVGVFISISLLIADVLLPIPSSIIMIANGAIYGLWLGALISILGGVGATILGYYIGRKGESQSLKFLRKEDLYLAHKFFDRWGLWAVIVSRSIPLLSETISVMSGISGWSIQRTILSSVIGYLPISILYAYSGRYITQDNLGISSFLIVMALASLTWVIGRSFKKNKENKMSNSAQ